MNHLNTEIESNGLQNRVLRRWTCVAAMLMFCLSLPSAGCVMPIAEKEIAAPPVANGPMYKVIFATSKGNPEVVNLNLNANTTIQEALDKSGATKKYKGMMVDLARRVKESGQVLKLPVTFDPKTGRVLDEQNYAVHAGDEILIRNDNPGAFNAVFSSLQGNDELTRR